MVNFVGEPKFNLNSPNFPRGVTSGPLRASSPENRSCVCPCLGLRCLRSGMSWLCYSMMPLSVFLSVGLSNCEICVEKIWQEGSPQTCQAELEILEHKLDPKIGAENGRRKPDLTRRDFSPSMSGVKMKNLYRISGKKANVGKMSQKWVKTRIWGHYPIFRLFFPNFCGGRSLYFSSYLFLSPARNGVCTRQTGSQHQS